MHLRGRSMPPPYDVKSLVRVWSVLCVWYVLFYVFAVGDPTFSNSLSPHWKSENRYIARLRSRKGLEDIKDRNVEFAVMLDQSTVTLTFDELRNGNTSTMQTFDTFEVDVHVFFKKEQYYLIYINRRTSLSIP